MQRWAAEAKPESEQEDKSGAFYPLMGTSGQRIRAGAT